MDEIKLKQLDESIQKVIHMIAPYVVDLTIINEDAYADVDFYLDGDERNSEEEYLGVSSREFRYDSQTYNELTLIEDLIFHLLDSGKLKFGGDICNG